MRKSCCCQPSLLSPSDADAGAARSDLARDNHHGQQQGHQHKLTQHCLHRHARFPVQILTVGNEPRRRTPQSGAKPPRMGTGPAAPCRNRLISEESFKRCPAGSRLGASSCIRPERPSADRGTWLGIEAAGAQGRHLWVDLGQALQHQAEIQSREFVAEQLLTLRLLKTGPPLDRLDRQQHQCQDPPQHSPRAQAVQRKT